MAVPIIVDRALLRQRLARISQTSGPDTRFLLAKATADLVDRLSTVQRHFQDAVVIGGFTADLADLLVQSGKTDNVHRMEICAALARCGDRPAFVGDEDRLAIGPGSVDLICTTLTLQFVNDLPGALLQVCRALRPDGLFLASLLGGQTLQELRQAFTEAEVALRGGAGPRILPFADVRDLGGLLQRAGFALPVADRDIVTVRYDSAFDLMRDVKAMGASNMLTDRERKLMRRDVLQRAADIYSQRFSDPDGRIRATFEIVSLSGWAPHDSQQKPARRGSAQVSLADLLDGKS